MDTTEKKTLNPEHLAHIPAYFQDRVVATRKDKTGAIKTTFDGGEVDYYFHGTRISLRSHVSPGYWGRWAANQHYFSTLTDAVESLKSKLRSKKEGKYIVY